MKNVYILIGLKGSGKSYIGDLVEKSFRIKFLQVEPYFINSSKDYKNVNNDSFKEVWEKIESDISKYLEKEDKIIFESMGTYDSFKEFLKRIDKKYNVKLIKIDTSSKLCLERIENRDNKNHVKINKNLIIKINKIASQEKYPFNLIINNEKLSDKDILIEFKKIF